MAAALLLLLFVLVAVEVAALALQGFSFPFYFSSLFREGLAFGFEVVRHSGVGLRVVRPVRAGAFFRQANLNVAGAAAV